MSSTTASAKILECARIELRRAIKRELPGPDPMRGERLEPRIREHMREHEALKSEPSAAQ